MNVSKQKTEVSVSFLQNERVSSQKPVLIWKEAGNKINIVILFITKSHLFLTLHGLLSFYHLVFFYFQEMKY